MIRFQAVAQALLALAGLTADPTASDAVWLKDGAVVRGVVTNPSDRGKLWMVVRRSWAAEQVPARLKAWETSETPRVAKATRERLERLRAWARERQPGRPSGDAGREDSLARALERTIERLEGPAEASALMEVAIERREVAKAERKSPAESRLLRLAWRSRLAEPETMALTELKDALAGRNFAVNGDDDVAIDDLLPVPVETDAEWRIRRAAAEVKADRGVWFVRNGNFVASEQAGAGGLNLGALAGVGDLSSLVRELAGDPPAEDPLVAKLRGVAARGGTGAVVTRVAIDPDLAGVEVTATLWVRAGDDRGDWKPAGERASRVSTAAVAAGANRRIAADPQVKTVFDVVDALGLGQVTPEMKERALSIGAATQQALGDVRTMADADLERLAVRLEP